MTRFTAALAAIGPLSPPHVVTIDGQRSSMRLEPAFWYALGYIADQNHLGPNQLIAAVDRARPEGVNMASAVRSFLLAYAMGGRQA